MNELDHRMEHIKQIKAIGQDIVDNADKIDGIVTNYTTSDPVGCSNSSKHNRRGSWWACRGLILELGEWIREVGK